MRLILRLLVLLVLARVASGDELPPGRVTGTFEGIGCEYSPGQEEVARLLAGRLAEHNRQKAAPAKARKGKPEPLSPAEMRANRSVYLRKILSTLDWTKSSRLESECYNEFLDNYEARMRVFELMAQNVRTFRHNRLVIWPSEELSRRLNEGEKIPNMVYDPERGRPRFDFSMRFNSGPDARLRELMEMQRKLRRSYQLNIKTRDGVTTYSAKVGPKRPEPKKEDASPAMASADVGPSYLRDHLIPVFVSVEVASLPPAEQAERLWNGPAERTVTNYLTMWEDLPSRLPTVDPAVAFIILHETIEVGVVDHYIRSPDRRWFCDGVANHVAWRILRDLHGEAAATRCYDLSKQLAAYADLREQIDLRRWSAVENQTEEEFDSRLNRAHYAFATRAVRLMEEQGGPDFFPRFFRELNRTDLDRVSMSTVEAAWKKLTGGELGAILTAAVAAPRG